MRIRCEWNPKLNVPAWADRIPSDCPNEATMSIGWRDAAYHLCDSCAKLPQFSSERRRVVMYLKNGG